MAATIVKKFVVTGGPCGGKTTGLNYIQEKLENAGIRVIKVPEIATLLMNSGLDPRKMDKEQFLKFQELIFDTQMHFEDKLFRRAMDIKGGDVRVMLCDRGCMDNIAYMGWEEFRAFLDRRQ